MTTEFATSHFKTYWNFRYLSHILSLTEIDRLRQIAGLISAQTDFRYPLCPINSHTLAVNRTVAERPPPENAFRQPAATTPAFTPRSSFKLTRDINIASPSPNLTMLNRHPAQPLVFSITFAVARASADDAFVAANSPAGSLSGTKTKIRYTHIRGGGGAGTHGAAHVRSRPNHNSSDVFPSPGASSAAVAVYPKGRNAITGVYVCACGRAARARIRLYVRCGSPPSVELRAQARKVATPVLPALCRGY